MAEKPEAQRIQYNALLMYLCRTYVGRQTTCLRNSNDLKQNFAHLIIFKVLQLSNYGEVSFLKTIITTVNDVREHRLI
jgi:hypothetical protein